MNRGARYSVVRENLRAAGFLQSGALHVRALVIGADASVSVFHGAVVSIKVRSTSPTETILIPDLANIFFT